ncbi:hypothetical protein [Rurimicrobium arvi]|uniref:ABC3 transporter permease C-terminal domain-containing protein n=1 Tax=Rurimicrobium arvi TaxID=2049916 RepID=A0ABP8MMU2_9BACT
MSEAKGILKKLLLRGGGKSRLAGAWITLVAGCLLLFVSVELWSTFRDILDGRRSQDSLGSTFLTISKKVEDASMADKNATTISDQELTTITRAPQVQDAGKLTPANFKVAASLGYGPMSFYTLLFLEAAPDRFMDQIPGRWNWKEGDRTIPIILSRDFLNMYNYIFAPSQGLPLLSEESVKALGFTLTMGEGPMQQEYQAQVEGFSDRISSVLVPQSFIDYGNRHFSSNGTVHVSRLILKVKDPSDKAFTGFLSDHHYTTNAEQLRFSKMRSVVEAVSAGTGVIALLLMFVSGLVFVLFIELTMAKAQESVRLLLQLGYSPAQLRLFLTRRYVPLMLSAVTLSLILTVLLKSLAAQRLKSLQLEIDLFPGLYVWIAVALSCLLLLWQTIRSISRSLKQ